MRTKTGLLVAILLGLSVLLWGCGGSQDVSTTTSGESTSTAVTQATTTTEAVATLTISAALKGANAVPAVKTSASGTLTLTIKSDGTVDYVLTLKKLSNITVARLRQGKAGTAATGTALFTLYDGPTKKGAFSGTLAKNSFTAADLGGSLKGKAIADFVTLVKSGQVYLNIGTTTHASGALRGQLAVTATATTTTTGASTGSSSTETTGGTQTSSSQGAGAAALTALFTKYQQTASVSLDFSATTADGTVTSGKMWEQAGKKMKIQTTANNVVNVMIIDQVANTMTIYQPATKQGMKTTVNIPVQDPESYAKDLNVGNVQDLGTENIDGDTCRVIQYTTTTGTNNTTATAKMWLSEKLGFPLKVEVTDSDGATTIIQYSNVKVGDLSSDTFKVPSDVKITTAP